MKGNSLAPTCETISARKYLHFHALGLRVFASRGEARDGSESEGAPARMVYEYSHASRGARVGEWESSPSLGFCLLLPPPGSVARPKGRVGSDQAHAQWGNWTNSDSASVASLLTTGLANIASMTPWGTSC